MPLANLAEELSSLLPLENLISSAVGVFQPTNNTSWLFALVNQMVENISAFSGLENLYGIWNNSYLGLRTVKKLESEEFSLLVPTDAPDAKATAALFNSRFEELRKEFLNIRRPNLRIMDVIRGAMVDTALSAI